jgi:hypothetical protein
MYGIQDKINQILRGAETIKKNSMKPDTNNCHHCGAKPMIHSYVCGTTFPNIAGNCSISEICKLNNEVARLREVCEWAADMMDGISPARGQEIRDAIARLAPSPEDYKTSAQIDKCIGNVTEPTNPTCSNTTHKFSHCDCENPTHIAPEWRELGPEEEIHTGDQVQAKHHDRVHGVWYDVFPYEIGAMPIDHEAFRYRTRRPLPKPVEFEGIKNLKQK